jgi:hypothetical protein
MSMSEFNEFGYGSREYEARSAELMLARAAARREKAKIRSERFLPKWDVGRTEAVKHVDVINWGLLSVGVLATVMAGYQAYRAVSGDTNGYRGAAISANNIGGVEVTRVIDEVEVTTVVVEPEVPAAAFGSEAEEAEMVEHTLDFVIGGVDLRQDFSIIVPVETARMAGQSGEMKYDMTAAVEDKKTLSREVQIMLASYGKYPNLSVTMRTHRPGVATFAFHSGTWDGSWLPGEVLDRIDNPVGAKLGLIQDGKTTWVEVVEVGEVDPDMAGVFGQASDTVGSVHLRLDKVGIKGEVDGVMLTSSGSYFEGFGRKVLGIRVTEARDLGAGGILPLYPLEAIENMEIAGQKVNAWFVANALGPGDEFSFNNAMGGTYESSEWAKPPGSLQGFGACDVATLLWRTVRDYGYRNEFRPELVRHELGYQVWKVGVFEVWLRPHERVNSWMPEDEVAVSIIGEFEGLAASDDTDFVIRMVREAEGMSVEFEVGRNEEDGSFWGVVEINGEVAGVAQFR